MIEKVKKFHWRTCCLYGVILTIVSGASLLICYQEKDSQESLSANPYNEMVDLKMLLSSIIDGKTDTTLGAAHLLNPDNNMTNASPLWPTYCFLVGEAHQLREEALKARNAYRALVKWAATDPYGDGWGCSGLVSVALWRWLELLSADPTPDHNEVMLLIEVTGKLRKTRLFQGMFNTSILGTLPKIEEGTLRRLALLAWNADLKDEARRIYLDYLKIASTAELSPAESTLLNEVIAYGLMSAPRLSLMRAKRLYSLRNYTDALTLLNEIRNSGDTAVRSEAELYLARLKRTQGASRGEVAALLSSVLDDTPDPRIAQIALFERALLFNRAGSGRNVRQFKKDLQQLVRDFPESHLADDALYELARYYQNAGDVTQALKHYELVYSFKGPNDWINLSHFHPALTLYTRREPGDIEKASALLRTLVKQQPISPLYLCALFWLGRIAEEGGNDEQSRSYFQMIISEAPYDYYAIRARMHLHLGTCARKELLPDSHTSEELRTAYQNCGGEFTLLGDSPYLIRLRNALKTGLYSMTLSGKHRLREIFPDRKLKELSLEELDETGMLTQVSVLLSLRQDALAAVDVFSSPGNRVEIAAEIGRSAEDWPLSMSLVNTHGESHEKRWIIQHDRRYLATAYPVVYGESIIKTSTARDVQPELLYSIMRRESLFYPAALSSRGALGLFQFMPSTFDALDRRWKLLGSSGAQSRETFLLDPDLNIDLGSRWFKDELLSRQKGNILLAVMEHNAGYPAVRKWTAHWEKIGRSDDIEYMVETPRYGQTRIFARRVLTDMAIVNAAGIFKANRR